MNALKTLGVASLLAVTGNSHVLAQEIYAGRYKAVLTAPPKEVPTSKTPDAALAGNGDIGLTLGGNPEALTLYLGKNDFWRAFPVYPGGGIALPGGLSINIGALRGASYQAEQIQDKALIAAKFGKDDLQVTLNSWVAATRNTVVAELTASKACQARINLWPHSGNTSVQQTGETDGIQWATRTFENTPLLEWPAHVALAMKVLGGDLSRDKYISLRPNQKVTIAVTLYTNNDRADWKEAAINEAKAQTEASIETMRREHEDWWRKQWAKSEVRFGDPVLEKYYYASQYLFASSSRAGKFAPGIWGPYISQDYSSWGGDYHLNYNYQAPFWAAYSSNYIDLVDNFDQPLLDYMDKGKQHAKELLGVRGIYYPVGIGPKGLVTTRWPLTPEEMLRRYGTRENTIDNGFKFLSQKINAVFSVGNMMMRFYSIYDTDYARRIYPYLVECANFWEDYLKFENGRYVIEMDHYGEVYPNLRNNGQWRDRLGDFNSTLSLGLVKMLFKSIIDVSNHLNVDADRHGKWNHILLNLSAMPIGTVDGRLSLKPKERGPGTGEVRASGLARVSIHGIVLPGGIAGPKSTPEFNKILLSDVKNWKSRMSGPGTWSNSLGNGIETNFPAAVRVGYDSDDVMQQLKDRIAAQSLPNLWITAAGGGLETLAAVPMTINEMMLQSYEHVVRVFPNWNRAKDASFNTLRAYGAFLVSSSLKGGNIEYVRLLSEKGRRCTMDNPWPNQSVQLTRNGTKAETLTGNTLAFDTAVNETIELNAVPAPAAP